MASSILNATYETHTLHHHKTLANRVDINSLKELPASYTWERFGNFPMKESTASETVPVIDLADPNAMELIGHACKTWGIFQLTNHGIPEKLHDDIEKASRLIFALPLEQKLKMSKAPNVGIAGFGRPAIDSTYTQKTWSEGFTVAGSPLEYCRRIWPEEYSKYCDMYEEYENRMRKLAAKIMWLCLGALGISKSDINWAGENDEFETADAAIHLNSYPACPDPDRTVGLPPHTDSSIFTIVHQKTVGLKIFRKETEWQMVPVVPDALVVNVGDFLHILSNGLYLNVIHQAVVNRTHQRISLAFFYGSPPKFKLSPVSKLVGPDETPLYRSVTWQEFLKYKAEGNFTALPKIRSSVPHNESG